MAVSIRQHYPRINEINDGPPIWIWIPISKYKEPVGRVSDIKLFSTTKTGHFGTGDLKVKLRTYPDSEKAKDLIFKIYEGFEGEMGEGMSRGT